MSISHGGHKSTYLPRDYVHEQNYECFLYSRPQQFRFNESAHVTVKRKTLATDLSKRLGLAKSSFWSSFLLELWLKSTYLPTYVLLPNLCPECPLFQLFALQNLRKREFGLAPAMIPLLFDVWPRILLLLDLPQLGHVILTSKHLVPVVTATQLPSGVHGVTAALCTLCAAQREQFCVWIDGHTQAAAFLRDVVTALDFRSSDLHLSLLQSLEKVTALNVTNVQDWSVCNADALNIIATSVGSLHTLKLGWCQPSVMTSTILQQLVECHPHLTSLVLTSAELPEAASSIFSCWQLSHLSLQGCKQVSLHQILPTSDHTTRLCSLNLNHSNVQDDAFFHLAVHRCSSLTILNVAHCALSSAALTRLSECCPKLTSLDVSHCELLDDDGLLDLCFSCPIEELILTSCSGITDEVALLAEDCETIRSIRAAQCIQLTDRFVETLSLNITSIQHVDLSRCTCIHDESLILIGRHCSELITLMVESNKHLTDCGIETLCLGVPKLEHLSLAWCCALTIKSVQHVSRRETCILRTLNTVGCVAINETSRAMISALVLKPTLTWLSGLSSE